MSQTVAILITLFCAFLASLGQTFFKIGSKTVNANLISWIFNWRIILGMCLYGLSAVLFIIALKHGKLSILYPIIASSYIWVMVISHFILKEQINYFNWIGVFLIICGVFMIALKGGIH
ncbi:MAG: EamA family transporter [Candidatus Tenebribacter burtonii]|jgi:uncharacterized membrane protein|nr:EamA family transporter [Candidatus Tenebribacter burtonii]